MAAMKNIKGSICEHDHFPGAFKPRTQSCELSQTHNFFLNEINVIINSWVIKTKNLQKCIIFIVFKLLWSKMYWRFLFCPITKNSSIIPIDIRVQSPLYTITTITFRNNINCHVINSSRTYTHTYNIRNTYIIFYLHITLKAHETPLGIGFKGVF